MNWYDVMARELNRAGTGARMTDVPGNRRASAISLLKLEREIASQISENEAMCAKSKSYAASSMPMG
ncbi:MAG: hypothetical protein NC429_10005 [Lachnospiraceae bacterium]|nr:hypothetical protein [Lachnospiraceae bacterium]